MALFSCCSSFSSHLSSVPPSKHHTSLNLKVLPSRRWSMLFDDADSLFAIVPSTCRVKLERNIPREDAKTERRKVGQSLIIIGSFLSAYYYLVGIPYLSLLRVSNTIGHLILIVTLDYFSSSVLDRQGNHCPLTEYKTTGHFVNKVFYYSLRSIHPHTSSTSHS